MSSIKIKNTLFPCTDTLEVPYLKFHKDGHICYTNLDNDTYKQFNKLKPVSNKINNFPYIYIDDQQELPYSFKIPKEYNKNFSKIRLEIYTIDSKHGIDYLGFKYINSSFNNMKYNDVITISNYMNSFNKETKNWNYRGFDQRTYWAYITITCNDVSKQEQIALWATYSNEGYPIRSFHHIKIIFEK